MDEKEIKCRWCKKGVLGVINSSRRIRIKRDVKRKYANKNFYICPLCKTSNEIERDHSTQSETQSHSG